MKGLDYLLDAIATLQSPGIFVIAGDGAERQHLEQLAQAKGIQDRVRFLPGMHFNDVPAFIRALDALVLCSVTIPPTHKEQFGRVLTEAMSAGDPVLGSTSGAIPEVIGDAGLVVPERDSVALAAQLERLLSDPQLRAELAERGRDRVSRYYGWPVVARQAVELYRTAIARRPSTSSSVREDGGTPLKVAVVGGAGFIGSNLVDLLVDRGDEVLVVDNFSTGFKSNINPKADVAEVDISTDSEGLVSALHGREVAYQLAALARVPRSIEDPVGTHEANITGTLRVFKAAVDAGVKRVVYSSSSSVYGDQPTLPLTEDMVPGPLNPYACQKYMGEIYAKNFWQVYGLETVCLRYFNVYGPRQVMEGAYRLVIGIFLDQMRRGEPLTIHGDGEQTRDFTWVGDIVRGNMLSPASPTRSVRATPSTSAPGTRSASTASPSSSAAPPSTAPPEATTSASSEPPSPKPKSCSAGSPPCRSNRASRSCATASSSPNQPDRLSQPSAPNQLPHRIEQLVGRRPLAQPAKGGYTATERWVSVGEAA